MPGPTDFRPYLGLREWVGAVERRRLAPLTEARLITFCEGFVLSIRELTDFLDD